MKQLGFFVDVSKCTGCRTCMVACKDGHNGATGMNYRHVVEHAEGTWQKTPSGAWTQNVLAYYVSTSCQHCSNPSCVKVCPTGAHHKRTEDGLVVIDQSKCIGCGSCAKACPYGAPVLNTTTHKMEKCDGCLNRLDNGKMPLCVESCPQRALDFGEISELRARYGKLADITPLPSSTLTTPSLVVKLPKKLSGTAKR
mgnify:CR=1 FL=1